MISTRLFNLRAITFSATLRLPALLAAALVAIHSPALDGADIISTAGGGEAGGPVAGAVVEFGLFAPKGRSQTVKNPKTPDGKEINPEGAEFGIHTERIAARRGDNFGFRFLIWNLPANGDVDFRTVVHHPPFKGDSGKIEDQYEVTTTLTASGGEVCEVTGYGFDHDFEMAPGKWRFEHWYKDKLIVAQEFTVLTPAQAEAEARKRKETLDAAIAATKLKPGDTPTVEQARAFVCLPQQEEMMGWMDNQVFCRLVALVRLGKGYKFQPADAGKWRELMQDESASIYGRMCAAQFLLEINDPAAQAFLAQELDSFHPRYAQNAAVAIREYVETDNSKKWGIAQMIRAISEDRIKTPYSSSSSIGGGNYPEGDRMDIMGENYRTLFWRLGFAKAKEAVPMLLSMLDKYPGSKDAIMALGDIGDPQAAPVIFKNLGRDDTDDERITALAKLHYEPLVPTLVERLRTTLKNDKGNDKLYGDQEIKALREFRDKAPIPVLQEWLANPKAQDKNQATLTIACLQDDPVAAMLELHADDWSEYEQVDIIWALDQYKDARVVARLSELGRTSPHSVVRYNSINGLADINTRASLTALADLYTADISALKDYWRHNTPTPAIFHAAITDALKDATKQDFGDDMKAWKEWIAKMPGS